MKDLTGGERHTLNIAKHFKDILEDLGKITGEVVTEDIIEEIFANFCLGK